MHDNYLAFVEEPSGRRFLRLRRQVLADADYRSIAVDLAQAALLLAEGRFAQALELSDELLPAGLLCPRLHAVAAEAAAALGYADETELERYLAAACLRGLQEAGDGSVERPYPITQTADVRDLLASLGREPVRQEIRPHPADGRPCDVVVCRGGGVCWFEASAVLAAASASEPFVAGRRG